MEKCGIVTQNTDNNSYTIRRMHFACEISKSTDTFRMYSYCFSTVSGPGSVVGIAIGYGLEGPGIETFRTCPDRPWGPPSLLYNGYRVFPGGKERLGRDADSSLPSSALVKKG